MESVGPHPLNESARPRTNRDTVSAAMMAVTAARGSSGEVHGSGRAPANSRASAEGAGIQKGASANCGNALIGENVETSASNRGPCLRSQIAPIAGMPRFQRRELGTPTGGISKSDSETVRIRSVPTRESGALIQTSPATSARGHCGGDVICTTATRTVRNDCASRACRPTGGTSKSDSETSVTDRILRPSSSRMSPSERQENPDSRDRLRRRFSRLVGRPEAGFDIEVRSGIVVYPDAT
jgi:hypothetical protein